MSSAKNDLEIKCFYYCGIGHIARDCYKNKNDENKHKHKRHTWHFSRKYLKHDLKSFVYDATLFDEIDKVGTWFVDSGTSTHMACNKH